MNENKTQLDKLNKIVKKFFTPHEVGVIFEIGSRDGVETLAFNQFYPNAIIHTFECNPYTVPLWIKNIENIKNIVRVEMAVSDKDGEQYFFPIDPDKAKNEKKDYNPGASSLFKSSGKSYELEKDSQKEVVVQTIKLSTYFKKNSIDRVDIMWMDIQGAELMALVGLGSDISKLSILNTEVEFVEIYQNQPLFGQIKKFMNANGFLLGYFTNINHTSADVVFINKKMFLKRPFLKLYLSTKDKIAYPVNRTILFARKVGGSTLRSLKIR